MNFTVKLPCFCDGHNPACSKCAGTGLVERPACPRCNGRGDIYGQRCPDCRGRREALVIDDG